MIATTMLADIHSVNHVGMAVRDMAKTTARFEAMGFVLTPFSLHAGAWKPNDAVAKLAYGNRCVMFQNNYLEILASESSEAPSARIAGFLSRHQGAHIICFGTEDPEGVDRRLKAGGMTTSGVLPLQRDIETPEGMRTAKFVRVQFSPDASPEGFIQAARHLTPQYIHQPRFMTHPNKCVALSEVFLVTAEPDALEAKYARYCDRPSERAPFKRTFTLPLISKVSIVAAQHAHRIFPGSLMPALPCIAGIAMQTSDLGALRRRLRNGGIAYTDHEHKVIVPAEEAMGVAIVFEES
jgi:hypothetical protein